MRIAKIATGIEPSNNSISSMITRRVGGIETRHEGLSPPASQDEGPLLAGPEASYWCRRAHMKGASEHQG